MEPQVTFFAGQDPGYGYSDQDWTTGERLVDTGVPVSKPVVVVDWASQTKTALCVGCARTRDEAQQWASDSIKANW